MIKKWILITDGSRGKILEKTKEGISNVGFTHHKEEFAVPSDKMHHSPGRARSSFHHVKSNYPSHMTPHDHEQKEFLKKMAEFMNEREENFENLIIMAPAKTLGILRKNLNKNALNKITKTVSKDYTHTPIDQIRHLF